jgi:hypothetical protein
MVNFENLTASEENLMNGVGVGLLVILAFYLISSLRIAKYLKSAAEIKIFSLFLVVTGVLSFVFVFSDVALLSDISKQYKHGLSQPEWSLVYPIMSLQFATTLIFTYLHLSGFLNRKQVKHVARDSNIFLAVQYVGLVCGLMGLTFASLGFVFPHSWNLLIHTIIGSIVLLVPYALAIFYWLVSKLREEHRQWYDEKQIQDVGKSAFLTLVLSAALMIVLFAANYRNLPGVVSALWLPLYLFAIIFLFSAGNLVFNKPRPDRHRREQRLFGKMD